MAAFRLNPRRTVSLMPVGEEREPVLIVDDVLEDASALIDYATWDVAFMPAGNPGGGYPGIRAPAPLPYVENVARGLTAIVERAFGLERVALSRAECNFSITTVPPEDLVAEQRIPHFDTDYPLQFAFLHYLCDGSFGGTAFYRHRASGFETLSPPRSPSYRAAVRRELAEADPPASYVGPDTAYYMRIGGCEARFNRMLIYRSCLLHSVEIRPGAALPPDPRRGRLTGNIFVNYRQR